MSTLRTDTLQTTDSAFSIPVADLVSTTQFTSYFRDTVENVVTNIAALRLVDPATYTKVRTLGYTTAGDAGAGVYYFDPTDTTSTDNGGTVIVGVASSRWKLVHNGTVTINQFGAKGDNIVDDTLAIQAAIDSGVKVIQAVAGKTHRITNTLLINSPQVMLDFNRSEVNLDDATGLKSNLKVGDGVTQVGGVRIRNTTFTRQQVATAGAAITTNFVGVFEVSGCRIYGNNRIWRGIVVNRGIIVSLFENYIDNCINRGIYLIGTGTGANRTVDVNIYHNRVEGGVTAMETSDFVEGLYCRDNIFFNTTGNGVVCDATTNANGLASFKLQHNDFDSHGGYGLYIDKVNNVQVTGCWFSNNTNDDLEIQALSDGVVVTGNQFYPNQSAVNAFGNNARVTGNIMAGGTAGVTISATATKTAVTDNSISDNSIGVNLSTAVDSHVSGNTFYNVTTPIAGTGGVRNVLRDNKGDVAVAAVSAITVGASPFVYTAGPRPEYVSIYSGTVSQISLGATQIASATERSVLLAPNQSVSVVYSVLPIMVKNIQ